MSPRRPNWDESCKTSQKQQETGRLWHGGVGQFHIPTIATADERDAVGASQIEARLEARPQYPAD